MEIDLGAIALTNNQILNWAPLKTGIWTWLGYIEGHVMAHASQDPTPEEISAMQAALAALPNVPPIPAFNLVDFQSLCFQAFGQGKFSTPVLRLDFPNLNIFATNLDWPGMKQYIQALIVGGAAIQADYDEFNLILSTWGIDLNAI
jgi:hypothetical protein